MEASILCREGKVQVCAKILQENEEIAYRISRTEFIHCIILFAQLNQVFMDPAIAPNMYVHTVDFFPGA